MLSEIERDSQTATDASRLFEMTENESAFLANAKRLTLECRDRDVDPTNPENLYDTYGQYFAALFEFLTTNYSISELSLVEWNQIISDYLASHPLPGYN